MEYYINTNEAWAAENGHGGAWGFHDILYLMDRANGGLIPHKSQIDAMEQRELWEKLPLAEYAGFLAYVSEKEQKSFLSKLPPQQREQLSAMLENEKKKQTPAKTEMEMAIEYEKRKTAQAKMSQALKEIESRRDMFLGSLPIDEYVEILMYLPREDWEAFLDFFPAKYQKQIMDHFTPEQTEEMRKHQANLKGSQIPYADGRPQSAEERSKRALSARDAAVEELRIAVQAWEARKAQTGEQGDLGLLMCELMATINALPKDQLDSSALSAMGVLEMLLGSKELEDLRKVGLNTDDIIKLIAYGVPAILYAAENNIELTGESLKGLFPDHGDTIENVLKILDLVPGPGPFVAAILKLAAAGSIKASEFLAVATPFLEGAAKAFAEREGIDSLEELFGQGESKSPEERRSTMGRGEVYLEDHPNLAVDTGRLYGYAGQLEGIIGRLEGKADALREAAAREAAKPEEERDEELIEAYSNMAERLVRRIPDMQKVIAYLHSTAETFDIAEARVMDLLRERV